MLNFFKHHSLVEGDYNLQQIEVVEEIGRGNSHVYNAIIKGHNYALKQIEVKSDYEYQSFLKEISFMKDLSQMTNCMVKYVGYFVTISEINQYVKQKHAYIIMECAEANLQNYISQGKYNLKLPKDEIFSILDFLIRAFTQLQEKKIAHCDIKPENILIMNCKNMEMKVCDVGSCKVINSEMKEEATIYGTVPFLAPELIKTHSQKIISSNAFKSDVFSFGLVLLYVITGKKFSAKERLEVNEETYFQVISEWIREGRELTSYDSRIGQVLKHSLQFDQFKRPLFKEIKQIYQKEKKKKKQIEIDKFKKLKEEEQTQKKYPEEANSNNYETMPLTRLNLFKSRNLTKISTKTSGIGFNKKSKTPSIGSPISTTIKVKRKDSGINSPVSRNGGSSPMSKRQNSCFSSSPEKMNMTVLDFKKIIYINDEDKYSIPYEYLSQEEKIFVLSSPIVNFKKAQIVTILSSCSLGVVYQLAEVEGKKLYVQYEGVDSGIGLAEDAPIVNFPKIYLNLEKTGFIGGYRDILRVFCPIQIQVLEVNLTKSEVTIEEVYGLLDRLSSREYLRSFSLCWQDNMLTPEQHSQFTQKIAKLSVKKLTLVMNGAFVKYDKQVRWLLPKNLQTLYLEYQHNFLGNILSNLSISLAKANLKQLYLNLQNNNLVKGEVNFLIKTISSIATLQKLVLNISMNPIEDIAYITSALLELKNVITLQIKMVKTGVNFEKVKDAISDLKYLFDRKLKIFKLGYDRKMKRNEFCHEVQNCLQEMKSLMVDVIGYDNKYFMAFIKKKQKINKSSKAMTSNRIKGDKTNHLGFKLQQKPVKQKAGQCISLYSGNLTYDNYLCLACSDLRQLSKNEYFCKYCIESCEHHGHNMVKIYERKRCFCAFGNKCQTDLIKKICADKLNIKYKKRFECMKCCMSLCCGCAQRCLQVHRKWVEESKQLCYFECGTQL